MPAALRTAQLTAYCGERDRAGGRLLADAVMAVYARHGARASVLLRGVHGFGGAHHRHTDRLLSLSDDLPVMAIALGAEDRTRAAQAALAALPGGGPALTTLEPAADTPALAPGGLARLTVAPGAWSRAVVALLRARGIAGATALRGVSGATEGLVERVPSLVVAIDDAARLARVAAELRAPALLEPVTALKWAGARTGVGLPRGELIRLTVFTSDPPAHGGQPPHRALVEELARAGAAGATSVHGTWGYAGDGAPHGDSSWRLRRRVPVVVSLVDTAPRAARWWALVDALTDAAGLVVATAVEAPRAQPPRAAPATGSPAPALA